MPRIPTSPGASLAPTLPVGTELYGHTGPYSGDAAYGPDIAMRDSHDHDAIRDSHDAIRGSDGLEPGGESGYEQG